MPSFLLGVAIGVTSSILVFGIKSYWRTSRQRYRIRTALISELHSIILAHSHWWGDNISESVRNVMIEELSHQSIYSNNISSITSLSRAEQEKLIDVHSSINAAAVYGRWDLEQSGVEVELEPDTLPDTLEVIEECQEHINKKRKSSIYYRIISLNPRFEDKTQIGPLDQMRLEGELDSRYKY